MNIRIVYGRENEKHKNYNLFGYTYIPAKSVATKQNIEEIKAKMRKELAAYR